MKTMFVIAGSVLKVKVFVTGGLPAIMIAKAWSPGSTCVPRLLSLQRHFSFALAREPD
jgi:hypothetical protein